MGKLENKVAIITGAASGIGRAASVLFAAEGAKVVIADIQEEQGEQVVNEIRGAGGEAIFVQTDVTQEQQVRSLIHRAIDHFGDLHILYNNAGMEELSPLHAIQSDSWDRQLNVNLKGTFLCCKYAVQHFMKKRQGVVLNTSSISGVFPSFDRPAYNAAKGGVIMLTRNIALQYGAYNIRANVICPGVVHTPMIAHYFTSEEIVEASRRVSVLRRIGSPEEIARPALFLVSDDASFITGACLFVDGGMNLGGFWRRFFPEDDA